MWAPPRGVWSLAIAALSAKMRAVALMTMLIHYTQTLRRRAEGGAADAPLLGRRRPTSTTGAACGNAVAGRGYFGVPVPAQPPNGLSEL